MAKATVLLSGLADRDLSDIAAYTIERFGSAQAVGYGDELFRAAILAAQEPQSGRIYVTADGLEMRRVNVGRHAIFYRQNATGILVVRVMHLIMNFEQHLS